MDVELLSGSARGDASALLGQFGSLLVFGSLLLSWFGLVMGGQAQRAASAVPVWAAERFMVSLTMLVVGVFALLNWESTFLDRRDVLVLGPLPVRARTLFTASIAAAASALGLTVVALNSLAGFVWPLALAPAGSGTPGVLRLIAAFWIALAAAGTFLYCGGAGGASNSGAIATKVVPARFVVSPDWRVCSVSRRHLLPAVVQQRGRSGGSGESTSACVAAVVLVPGTAERTERSVSFGRAPGDGGAGAKGRGEPGHRDPCGWWSVPAFLRADAAKDRGRTGHCAGLARRGLAAAIRKCAARPHWRNS